MSSNAYREPPLSSGKAAWAIGLTAMAGFFLLLAGAFQFFQGLAALLKGDFFVVAPNNTYAFTVSAWGWIHLLIGIVAVVVGFALLAGQAWARVIGVILALLSAISNFLFLPYYPLWGMVVIALDIAVIWALTVYGRAAD